MATAALPVMKPDPTEADDSLFEVIGGVRVEHPDMAARSNIIKSDLHGDLSVYVRKNGLGRAACETLFILDDDEDEQRRPDVAFVSKDRWPLDREIPLEGDWAVVPDLAIEVSSAHDKVSELVTKISDYFRFGVRQVWVVFPETEMIYVYDSPTDVRVLKAPQALESPQLLPGFSLPLAELFHTVAPATP